LSSVKKALRHPLKRSAEVAASFSAGRWRIYGINLPETILRKVYFENAARQLAIAV